jgi:hypothetical protein
MRDFTIFRSMPSPINIDWARDNSSLSLLQIYEFKLIPFLSKIEYYILTIRFANQICPSAHRYGWLRPHHPPRLVDGVAYVDSCLTSQYTLVKPISHTKPYKPTAGVPSMEELSTPKCSHKSTFTFEWDARLDFYLHALVYMQVDIRILSKVVDRMPSTLHVLVHNL